MRVRIATLVLLLAVVGVAVLSSSQPSGFTGTPWWTALPVLLAAGFLVYLVQQSRRR